MTAEKTEQVMVRLTPEMHEQLKAYAVADDRPIAQVVRMAVVQYLKSREL